MPHASLLEDRSVVVLSGPDASGFLQGLITNDMAECASGKAIYAALLTPQGKILFDFFVVERDGCFLLDSAAWRANDFVKRLGLYKLRAKVEIVPAPDRAVAAIWNGDAGATDAPGLGFADPRL